MDAEVAATALGGVAPRVAGLDFVWLVEAAAEGIFAAAGADFAIKVLPAEVVVLAGCKGFTKPLLHLDLELALRERHS